MTVSPFDDPATLYREHSAVLEDASVSIPYPEGSGKVQDALVERIARYQTVLTTLSASTASIADASEDQAHADRALATYPTHDDVAEQRAVVVAAVACGDTKTAALEKVLLDEMWERRKEKLDAHERQCSVTTEEIASADLDVGDIGTGPGLTTDRSAGGNDGLDEDDVRKLPGSVPEDDPFHTAPEASALPAPVADTDTGTALSSSADAGTATRTPSLYTGPPQPSMSPMHMQGSPQGGGGVPFGGVPSAAQNSGTPTSRARGTQLNSTPVRDPKRTRDRKRDNDTRSADAPAVVVSTPIDRGSSVSGTTTNADTSGGAKTNLSASTAQQTQQNPLAQHGRGPMGPMGGVPPMGAGGGISGMKPKTAPEIFSTDARQVGFDKDAVNSGALSRDNANTPEPDPVATGIPNRDKVSR